MATFKDPNLRPCVEPPLFDSMPIALRRIGQWLLWKYVWKAETSTWAKVPHSPHTLGYGKSDDPATWGEFDFVRNVYETNMANETNAVSAGGFDGVGFVFTPNDPFVGIDFDNCVMSVEGELLVEPSVAAWIAQLNSYTEISVSGTGLHVITTGVFGGGRKDTKTGIEIYDRGRYFTVSGRGYGDEASPRWRQSVVEILRDSVFPVAKSENFKAPPSAYVVTTDVDELLRLAFASKNGDSIFRLYQGGTGEYGDDDSSADLALCSKLAFWSQGRADLLDAMFRASRLFRAKWDKRHSSDGRTYGQMTVEKALRGCAEFYSGRREHTNVYIGQPDVSGEIPRERERNEGIYYPVDLREKLVRLWEEGRAPGESPGWNNLKEFYTVKRGQFTIVLATPNTGKTPFLDNLMMNLARGAAGWRFAVCSLETQPIELHLSMLMELYTGKPFNPGPNTRMTVDDIDESLEWFQRHFVFLLPPEASCTMYTLLEMLDEVPAHDGVVIDPWNEFEFRRPPQMTETEYVGQVLSKMRRRGRSLNQHWWLAVHPTKLKKDKDGNYPLPSLYDAAGSANFRNKPDIGIVLDRDQLTEGAPLIVHIQKMKFRWCGKLGSCELYYDPVTGRFEEYPVVRTPYIGRGGEDDSWV